MRQITLGSTGITTPQNAFGALPIQRVSMDEAVKLLLRAYEGGMTYFDTARNYSDSEEKLGEAFDGMRSRIHIATKTHCSTPDEFWRDLETSLRNLRTDYIDLYQLHFVPQCFRPDDGTGLYECLVEAKRQGMIRHIGITAHRLDVAWEIVKSGLYETLQFPFSYLSDEKDFALVRACAEAGIGFLGMKGMSGGLITHSAAAMAFLEDFDNVVPLWGVQKMSELEEWLSYMDNTPVMNDEYREIIRKDREELSGNFCRGCGYCLPCPQEINIPTCARMTLFLKRAPVAPNVTPEKQAMMEQIEKCINCRQCASRCPYGLDTPGLLKKNLDFYRRFLAGEVTT